MSIHDKIAADAFPNGAWLKCHDPRCDRGERVTTATAAEYLAHGWPQALRADHEACHRTAHLRCARPGRPAMTEEQLEQIRARAEAATPGTWTTGANVTTAVFVEGADPMHHVATCGASKGQRRIHCPRSHGHSRSAPRDSCADCRDRRDGRSGSACVVRVGQQAQRGVRRDRAVGRADGGNQGTLSRHGPLCPDGGGE
jgi:hypothetical protein